MKRVLLFDTKILFDWKQVSFLFTTNFTFLWFRTCAIIIQIKSQCKQ